MADEQESQTLSGLKPWITTHHSPPLTIRHDATLQKISAISRDPPLRDRFLDGLRTVRDGELDYVDLLVAFGVVDEDSREYNHLRKHWYPKEDEKDDFWWPELYPIVNTIVDGLIRAFEYARSDEKPIEYYWMIIGDDDPDVKFKKVVTRVYHREPVQSILLAKYTPPPPI